MLTAFAIVIGFTPVKNWLQGQVDRRIGDRSPSALLNEFRAEVEAVVSVIDVERVARRLLDQAVTAFGARGAAIYLQSNGTSVPLYSRGQVSRDGCIEVPLRHQDRDLGRLLLGTRRGGANYSDRDRELLQRSADSVGEAIALAEHLSFKALPKIS